MVVQAKTELQRQLGVVRVGVDQNARLLSELSQDGGEHDFIERVIEVSDQALAQRPEVQRAGFTDEIVPGISEERSVIRLRNLYQRLVVIHPDGFLGHAGPPTFLMPLQDHLAFAAANIHKAPLRECIAQEGPDLTEVEPDFTGPGTGIRKSVLELAWVRMKIGACEWQAGIGTVAPIKPVPLEEVGPYRPQPLMPVGPPVISEGARHRFEPESSVVGMR